MKFKRGQKPIDCFVQVNTSLEPSKHGMAKEEVLPFVKTVWIRKHSDRGINDDGSFYG